MLDKIKQLKDLRAQAKELKQTLAQETVRAEAAGGKVTIVMNGNQEVTACEISPDLLISEKKAELEQAVAEAVNSGIKDVQRLVAQKMQSGGFNIPGLS